MDQGSEFRVEVPGVGCIVKGFGRVQGTGFGSLFMFQASGDFRVQGSEFKF